MGGQDQATTGPGSRSRMEFGLFTEFHCPPEMSETAAFDESMAQMRAAEEFGYDAVWLAELHFQKGRSVLSDPLVVGAALAAVTQRIKLGIAVQVLPLTHPLRLAEAVATVDQLSHGRLDFGVGRSGLPGHYQGFNIPYSESRERFLETLEILRKAWTEDRFSHEGTYFRFHDVSIVPKPYQKPHPPLRMAATTAETYPIVGRLGLPLFVAPRTIPISDLLRFIGGYHRGWQERSHPGRGEVAVGLPIYVADTDQRACAEAEASTMHFFRTIARALQKPGGNPGADEKARRLAEISYDTVLREQVIYGSPESVADRLLALQEGLGFSICSAWMNAGGRIPHERVLTSMRLFAERVAPRLV